MEEKIIGFILKDILRDNESVLISSDDDLFSEGLIESMGMVRLIQYIEDEFEIKITPQDMTIDHFMTVNAMVGFIKTKLD